MRRIGEANGAMPPITDATCLYVAGAGTSSSGHAITRSRAMSLPAVALR